jgi:putative heme-binding domain-containing protein
MRLFPSLPWALVCALLLGLPGTAAAQNAQDHTYTTADIEAGSRIYSSQCALCHGPNGDGVSGIDLRRGVFRRVTSDEDLARVIGTGVSGSGMPAFKLQPSEMTAIIAFIRAGFDKNAASVTVGDVTRGRTLFEGKGACTKCHRVNGSGSRTAPDLSDIGAVRTAALLQKTLADPSSTMWPINRPVFAITKDGRNVRGRRLNEDTFSVQLIDESERLVSLLKSDLSALEVSTVSPMPPATKTLSNEEVSHVIAYLLSLKGLQ